MSHFISSDGVSLYFTDEGDGRPVILIAGYGGNTLTWSAQIGALKEAGYRVIAFDRRSHGRSENAVQGQHLARHAADVHELMEYLSLDQPVLIGQSMGASVIYAFLSVFSDREIAGAVCIDQTPRMLNEGDWNLGMYGFDRDSMAVFFDDPIPDGLYRDPGEGYLEPYQEALAEAAGFDKVTTKPLLLEHAYADWRDVFSTIVKPMLFIAGKNSPYWSCEHAVYCAEHCKNGTYQIIEECGHIVQIERSGQCNRAILAFLKEICF